MTTIDRAQLQRMIDEGAVTVVEVLGPQQYEDVHLPNALNKVPFDAHFDEEIQSIASDKSQSIAVYCMTESCDASPKAADRLAELGHQRVYDYAAGKQDWRRAAVSAALFDTDGEPIGSVVLFEMLQGTLAHARITLCRWAPTPFTLTRPASASCPSPVPMATTIRKRRRMVSPARTATLPATCRTFTSRLQGSSRSRFRDHGALFVAGVDQLEEAVGAADVRGLGDAAPRGIKPGTAMDT